MSDISSISYLEQLPNELFLEIFSFFSASDLQYSWLRLNYRITAILRSTDLFICVKETEDIVGQKVLFTQFHDQVISLKDYRRYPHSPLNLCHFINLRLLILNKYFLEQTEVLKPLYMPQLEHLSLNYCSAPYSLFERILFSTFERFLHLLSFKAYNVRWIHDESRIQTTINTTLQTLHYNKIYGVPLTWLGYSFQNLIVFKGTIKNCPESDKPPLMLRRVDVYINGDCLHIEQLVHLISKLTHLRLRCTARSWSFFYELASALHDSRFLKEVRLKIDINPSRMDFFDLELARSMSSKWFGTLEQSNNSSYGSWFCVYTPRRGLSKVNNT